jgi:hypothetical protein
MPEAWLLPKFIKDSMHKLNSVPIFRSYILNNISSSNINSIYSLETKAEYKSASINSGFRVIAADDLYSFLTVSEFIVQVE